MSSSSVGAEEVARALQHLLDAPEFRRNRNASVFLKFVVDETLAGRGDRLKAFTIATLALQRDDTFDPQNNSIVRVQATRVRQMLETFYAGPGAADPVQIVLPRGSYVPSFVRFQSAPVAEEQPKPSVLRRLAWPIALSAASLLLGLVLGAGVDGILGGWRSSNLSARTTTDPRAFPVLKIEIGTRTQKDAGTETFLASVLTSLRNRFAAFDYFKVSQDGIDGSEPDYLLTISQLGGSDTTQDLTFNLIFRPSGSIVWTSIVRDLSVSDVGATLQKVARAVVPAVGDMFGVVLTDWASRAAMKGQPLSGSSCAYAAYGFFRTRSMGVHDSVANCLEADLKADPDNTSAMGLLALLLLRDYADATPGSHGAVDLQRALQLARRNYDRAPHRSRSQFVLGMARFFDQRYDDAFGSMEQAFGTNPYSSIIRVNLGAGYVARGQIQKGVSYLYPEGTTDAGEPGHFSSYMAVAAYLKGDSAQLDRWAMRQSTLASPLGMLVRLIAVHRRGDKEACADIWLTLQRTYPAFAANVRASLRRLGFQAEIADHLSNDIEQIMAEYRLAP